MGGGLNNYFPETQGMQLYQPENPLDAYLKATQIHGMQAQTQGVQAQTDAQNLQNQQTRVMLNDYPKINAALTASQGNPDQYLKELQKQQVSPQTYFGQQTMIQSWRQKNAELDKDTLANHAALSDQYRGQLLSIINGPEDQKQSAWTAELQKLPASETQNIPGIYPGDDVATSLANHFALGSTLAKEATAQQEANAKTQQAATEASKFQATKDPTSALYNPGEGAVLAGTAPLSQQILAGKTQQAASTAGAEASARQPFEIQLAATRAQIDQAVKNGSARDAGRMLAQGLIAPSEVAARSNPSFLVQANHAALAVDPNYKAQQAEANFNVAKSEANTPFFGSANSLIAPGGTLDQLQAAGAKLKNTAIPLVNKGENFLAAQTGRPAIAAYNQTVLGAADDYAKVMGGGTASDNARNTLIQSLSSDKSPQQINAAISAARAAVNSQIQSRIGNNKALQNMYGLQAPEGGATTFDVTDPRGVTHRFPTQQAADKFKQQAGIQ